jgi:hypothetical protein
MNQQIPLCQMNWIKREIKILQFITLEVERSIFLLGKFWMVIEVKTTNGYSLLFLGGGLE